MLGSRRRRRAGRVARRGDARSTADAAVIAVTAASRRCARLRMCLAARLRRRALTSSGRHRLAGSGRVHAALGRRAARCRQGPWRRARDRCRRVRAGLALLSQCRSPIWRSCWPAARSASVRWRSPVSSRPTGSPWRGRRKRLSSPGSPTRLRDARLPNRRSRLPRARHRALARRDGAADLLFDSTPVGCVRGACRRSRSRWPRLAAGLLAPRSYRVTGETGPLAFVTDIRRALSAHTVGIAETLVATAVALGVLATGLVLVAVDFEAGHVALTGLASAWPRQRRPCRRVASLGAPTVAAFGASLAVLVKALMFDLASSARQGSRRARPCSSPAPACSPQVSPFASSGRRRRRLVIVSAGAATVALGAAL